MVREAITGQSEIAIPWPNSVSLYKRGELDEGALAPSVPAKNAAGKWTRD